MGYQDLVDEFKKTLVNLNKEILARILTELSASATSKAKKNELIDLLVLNASEMGIELLTAHLKDHDPPRELFLAANIAKTEETDPSLLLDKLESEIKAIGVPEFLKKAPDNVITFCAELCRFNSSAKLEELKDQLGEEFLLLGAQSLFELLSEKLLEEIASALSLPPKRKTETLASAILNKIFDLEAEEALVVAQQSISGGKESTSKPVAKQTTPTLSEEKSAEISSQTASDAKSSSGSPPSKPAKDPAKETHKAKVQPKPKKKEATRSTPKPDESTEEEEEEEKATKRKNGSKKNKKSEETSGESAEEDEGEEEKAKKRKSDPKTDSGEEEEEEKSKAKKRKNDPKSKESKKTREISEESAEEDEGEEEEEKVKAKKKKSDPKAKKAKGAPLITKSTTKAELQKMYAKDLQSWLEERGQTYKKKTQAVPLILSLLRKEK